MVSTQLKNITIVNLDHSPKVRRENKTKLSCHHLDIWVFKAICHHPKRPQTFTPQHPPPPRLCEVKVSIKASQGCTAAQDFVAKASQQRTSAGPFGLRPPKVREDFCSNQFFPRETKWGFLPFWEGKSQCTTSTIEEFRNMKIEEVEKDSTLKGYHFLKIYKHMTYF